MVRTTTLFMRNSGQWKADVNRWWTNDGQPDIWQTSSGHIRWTCVCWLSCGQPDIYQSASCPPSQIIESGRIWTTYCDYRLFALFSLSETGAVLLFKLFTFLYISFHFFYSSRQNCRVVHERLLVWLKFSACNPFHPLHVINLENYCKEEVISRIKVESEMPMSIGYPMVEIWLNIRLSDRYPSDTRRTNRRPLNACCLSCGPFQSSGCPSGFSG